MADQKEKDKIIAEIKRYDDFIVSKERQLKDLSISLSDTHNKLQNVGVVLFWLM